MFSVGRLELIPLLLFLCIWFGGFGVIFYMLWRLVKAVERIADNVAPRQI